MLQVCIYQVKQEQQTSHKKFVKNMECQTMQFVTHGLLGYSSEYTAAIWTGYTDTSQGHYISNSEQSAPWYVFKNLMSYLNPAGYVEPTRPDSVVSVTIEKESGAEDGQVQLASSLTPDAYKASELFPKGSQPSVYSTRFEQISYTTKLNRIL